VVALFAVAGLASHGSSSSSSSDSPATSSWAPGVESNVSWSPTVARTGGGVAVFDKTTGAVLIVDPASQQPVSSQRLYGYVDDASAVDAFSADGSRLASVATEGPGPVVSAGQPSGAPAPSATVGADVRSAVRVWDTNTGSVSQVPWSVSGPAGAPVEVAISGPATVVAALKGGTQDQQGSEQTATRGKVAAWSVSGPQLLDLTVDDLRGGLTLSPDGKWLAFRVGGPGTAADGPGRYRLVQLGTRKSVDLKADCLGSIQFSPTADRVYCTHAGTIEVLDLTGRRVGMIHHGAQSPGLMAISPDGGKLAQVDISDGNVRVLGTRLGDLQLEMVLIEENKPPAALAFSPDGTEITGIDETFAYTEEIPAP
jgi:hypothetical protein